MFISSQQLQSKEVCASICPCDSVQHNNKLHSIRFFSFRFVSFRFSFFVRLVATNVAAKIGRANTPPVFCYGQYWGVSIALRLFSIMASAKLSPLVQRLVGQGCVAEV